jgi:hypothetical protein
MKITEDEKIRLAFEERAFHTIDPDFRKDEVWQKIQMRLNSTNNKSPNKYTIAGLILLILTLSGWIITYQQYSQLDKKNISLTHSEENQKKISAISQKIPDTISPNVPGTTLKPNKKEITFKNKIRKQIKAKDVAFEDSIKNGEQAVDLAELISEEKPQEVKSLANEVKKPEDQENYFFSFKKNQQQKIPHERNLRKIKIKLYSQGHIRTNSEEMSVAELPKTNE